MLLNKIKIKGFKSFADEVELELEKGITAIVGPNGCGKSNVADSINWALGEQSPTALRGKKMEQMIFNGSSSRKSMGMAEVTLTLRAGKDLERSLDFDDEDIDGLERDGSSLAEMIKGIEGDISITRRMFRDSQSDYLLNGQPCRLKDIQDLLMALGIGTRVITIIEQDKIASIISSKPVDRRVLIEDAAGITKFKLNRHLTQLKLEHARNNLSRIEDLLAEQEIHVRSLKRQAQKANRFRKFQAEIRHIESNIIAVKYNELKAQQESITAKIKSYEEQMAFSSSALTGAESEEAKLRQKIDELAARKVHKREAYYQNNLELDRSTNRLKHLRENLEDFSQRTIEARQRLSDSKARLGSNKETIEATRKEIADLEAMTEQSSFRLEDLQEKADKAEREVKELRVNADVINQNLMALRERRAGESSRLKSLNDETERLTQMILMAKANIEKAQSNISELSDRVQLLEQRSDDLDHRYIQIEGEMARSSEYRKGYKQEIQAIQRRIDALKGNQTSAEATLEALREMEERHEGIEESARTILSDQELSTLIKPLGVVADYIEVDPAHSTTTVAAYDRLLEAVLVEDEASIQTGLNLLKERNIGRASFVALNSTGTSYPSIEAKNDLRNFIKPRGDKGEVLIKLFPKALYAEDISTALKLSGNNPGVVVSTPDGSLIKDGSLVRGGGEHVSSKIFTRRQRMEELKQQVEAINSEMLNMQGRKDDLEEKDEKLILELENLKKETENIRIQKAELAAQANATRKEQETRSESIEVYQREIQLYEKQQGEAEETLEKASGLVTTLEEEIENKEYQLEDLTGKLEQKTEAALSQRQEENQLRTQVSTVEERIRSAQNREKSLIQDEQDVKKRILMAEQEIAKIEEQKKFSLREIEAIEGGMQDVVDKSKTLSLEIDKFDSELGELDINLKESQTLVKKHRKELNQVKEELDEFRMQSREQIIAIQHLKERAAENLKIEESEFENIQVDDDDLDYDTAISTLAKLKEKLDNMGAVNLLASEEYETQLERFNTLKSQQEDIIESIKSLNNVIDRIDRVSRAKFKDAFEKINDNFHRIFRILFKGGKSELLLNEGDLLTAGIEIMVQPPGKRNQSASLLSGGEKTLSSFALILAVMEYRPTPFCVPGRKRRRPG
jgi:chromosome segregation protein